MISLCNFCTDLFKLISDSRRYVCVTYEPPEHVFSNLTILWFLGNYIGVVGEKCTWWIDDVIFMPCAPQATIVHVRATGHIHIYTAVQSTDTFKELFNEAASARCVMDPFHNIASCFDRIVLPERLWGKVACVYDFTAADPWLGFKLCAESQCVTTVTQLATTTSCELHFLFF